MPKACTSRRTRRSRRVHCVGSIAIQSIHVPGKNQGHFPHKDDCNPLMIAIQSIHVPGKNQGHFPHKDHKWPTLQRETQLPPSPALPTLRRASCSCALAMGCPTSMSHGLRSI